MNKIFLLILVQLSTALLSTPVLAQDLETQIKNAQEGDFTFCASSDHPDKTIYLFAKDGNVYTSKSIEPNPLNINDFSYFAKKEVVNPDANEQFVFTINNKKYSGDYADKIKNRNIYFVLLVESDGYASSGFMISNNKEFKVRCVDVSFFINAIYTRLGFDKGDY